MENWDGEANRTRGAGEWAILGPEIAWLPKSPGSPPPASNVNANESDTRPTGTKSSVKKETQVERLNRKVMGRERKPKGMSVGKMDAN